MTTPHPTKSAPAPAAVAYRVLRKRHDGEWVTDGRAWCDGVPTQDLVGDIALRSDGWRIEYAFAAPTTQAAPQREVFDEDGFRAWVIRNLPDNTIIGSSEYWANYLATWVQRFMSAAPQAAPASQDAEDALVAALIECDRLTESMRIWAGMGYHYHPPQARQIHDTARAAIDAARAAKEGEHDGPL